MELCFFRQLFKCRTVASYSKLPMHLDYALLSEFASLSVNGLHSFMHVFDKTAFKENTSLMLRGFLAVKCSELEGENACEIYMTDKNNVILDKGHIMKGKIKGPAVQIVLKIAVPIPAPGTYSLWIRVENGEPKRLLMWSAEVKAG